MGNQLTQHRLQSFGEILDYVRSGNKTILESVEIDVNPGRDRDDELFLEVGHPTSVRRKTWSPIRAEDFFRDLLKLQIRQIVIDVDARTWDDAAGESQFQEGERELLYEFLPRIVAEYRAGNRDARVVSEFVITSSRRDVMEDIRDGKFAFDQAVSTRWYVKDTSGNPFEEVKELGANQVVFLFPNGDHPERELGRLHELSQLSANRGIQVVFFTRGNVSEARLVEEYFSEAEIVTDVSTAVERERKERRAPHPR